MVHRVHQELAVLMVLQAHQELVVPRELVVMELQEVQVHQELAVRRVHQELAVLMVHRVHQELQD